jgi:hypothetical protein
MTYLAHSFISWFVKRPNVAYVCNVFRADVVVEGVLQLHNLAAGLLMMGHRPGKWAQLVSQCAKLRSFAMTSVFA